MRRFCLIIFLVALSCKSSTETLPVLSYTINDNGQKAYYTITYSGFTNQLGQDFSTENLKENICIANFFFTRCPSICPPMRNALIDIAETVSDENDLLIISHTIDPEHDSVAVLKDYAETTGIPPNKWQFIRASETRTKAQAKQYMTNFKPNNDGTDFYHSSYVALIDKQQQIRGFYDILVEADVSRLLQDITLLAE